MSSPTFNLTHLVVMFAMLIRIVSVATMLLSNNGLTEIPRDVIAEMEHHVIRDHDVQPLSGKRQSSDATDLHPPQKQKQIKHDSERAKKCAMDDWLVSIPMFPEKSFEQTFCINHTMVDTIINHLICPQVKFLCAQKMLCYGVSASPFVDYFQMGDTTSRRCLSKLTQGMVDCNALANVYL